jgi:hypothetical protein
MYRRSLAFAACAVGVGGLRLDREDGAMRAIVEETRADGHRVVRTHVLAYNLIRTIMAQAASAHGIEPRTISFKGTLQLLNAFQPVIAGLAHAGVDHLELLYQQMLRAIVQHRVADRPDRFEPRMSKRKPKGYDRLTRPRKDIKREIMKGLSKP